MRFILLLLVVGGAYLFYQDRKSRKARANLPAEVKQVAAKSEKDQKITPATIRQLKSSLSKTKTPEARGLIVKALALAVLATEPENFHKLRLQINGSYPDENYLDFLNDEFPKKCTKCKGVGATECKTCRIKGQCANGKCAGTGKIEYETFDGAKESKNCPICKGSGKCGTCKGSGLSNKACWTCKGIGHLNVQQSKARQLYFETIGSM